MKKCICCGMPMNKKTDFAMENEEKDYCIYCSKEDGSMKSFEEAVEGMTEYMSANEKVSKDSVREKVLEYMKSMPAWKENF